MLKKGEMQVRFFFFLFYSVATRHSLCLIFVTYCMISENY